jgi:hypothetical protein
MKKIYSIAAVALVFALTSCEPQGCTDETADNYDADAEKDDGTCEYTAEILFYSDSISRKRLFDDGVNTPVDIYVNEEKIGSLNYYNYIKDAPPECGDDYSDDTYQEVLQYTFTLIRPKEDAVDIEIKDNTGEVIATSYTGIEAGQCRLYRI